MAHERCKDWKHKWKKRVSLASLWQGDLCILDSSSQERETERSDVCIFIPHESLWKERKQHDFFFSFVFCSIECNVMMSACENERLS